MAEKVETFKDKVLSEYEKGNVVMSAMSGLGAANLKEFIEQPVDGMLYDLNRAEMVVLAFIDDPKWVNDYAVCKVIRALKERIDELELTVQQSPNVNFTDSELQTIETDILHIFENVTMDTSEVHKRNLILNKIKSND